MRSFGLALLCLAAAPVAEAQSAEPSDALGVAASEEWGDYLVGPGGAPLYVFITDERGGDDLPDVVSCEESCLDRWPLLEAAGVTVGDGVDPELVSALEWEGEEVVVYDGYALFTYVDDVPGDAPQGQGLHEFGGWWYLVAPDGDPIEGRGGPEVDGPEGPPFDEAE